MATKEVTGTVPGMVAGEATEPRPGGIHDVEGAQNSVEMAELADFAVKMYNITANARLKFAWVAMAKEQVVAGMMYYVIFVAIDLEGGEKKLCGAKVWVNHSNCSKQLKAFKIFDVVNLAAN